LASNFVDPKEGRKNEVAVRRRQHQGRKRGGEPKKRDGLYMDIEMRGNVFFVAREERWIRR
jgi:hypothetical protein